MFWTEHGTSSASAASIAEPRCRTSVSRGKRSYFAERISSGESRPTFASCRELRRALKRRKNHAVHEFGEFGEGWWQRRRIERYVDSCSRSSSFRKKRRGNEPYHFRHSPNIRSKLEIFYKDIQCCDSNSNRTVENRSTTIYTYIHWRESVRPIQGVKSC